MRIKEIVFLATTAFTLGICQAMAAPIDLEAQPLPRDVPSADPAEHDAPRDRSDPDGADEAIPRCELDGCEYEHQGCVCSNTGWNGYCGWGPHHPGCLYCRCD